MQYEWYYVRQRVRTAARSQSVQKDRKGIFTLDLTASIVGGDTKLAMFRQLYHRNESPQAPTTLWSQSLIYSLTSPQVVSLLNYFW